MCAGLVPFSKDINKLDKPQRFATQLATGLRETRLDRLELLSPLERREVLGNLIQT